MKGNIRSDVVMFLENINLNVLPFKWEPSQNIPGFSSLLSVLLQKGGSFVPLPKQVNMTGVEVSARKFERKCLWKYWFFSHPDATSEPPHPIFQRPPKTNIPPGPPPKPLSDFVSAIRSELVGTKPRRVRPNFTKSSMENFEELIRLQKQGHLVIVPCDKTGGFAAYNRNEYIEKMMEILFVYLFKKLWISGEESFFIFFNF